MTPAADLILYVALAGLAAAVLARRLAREIADMNRPADLMAERVRAHRELVRRQLAGGGRHRLN